MAAALLAASCGGGGAAEEPEPVDAAGDAPVSVDFLIPDTSANIVDPAYEVLGESFTERTGTTVEFVNSGGDYGAVEERILAARVAGSLPDAAIISSASIRTYVDAALAQPFDPLIEADESFDPDATVPSLLDFGACDDETLALPLTASWVVLYYNAEVFEAAGLDPEDPPTTFGEVEDAARQIVESGAAPNGLGFRFIDDPNMWRLQNVLASAGGALMTADESELTFYDPALVGLVEFLGGLAADDVIGLYDSDSISEAFFRGDVGMAFDASSSARVYTERELRLPDRPYPVLDEGDDRVLLAGGASVVMFTDDPARQRGVWELLEALGWCSVADLVLSPGEGGRGRPCPDMILVAVLRLGVSSVRNVAVAGDTASDLHAGWRAGAGIVAGVTSGAHDRATLQAAPHTHLVETVPDLEPELA